MRVEKHRRILVLRLFCIKKDGEESFFVFMEKIFIRVIIAGIEIWSMKKVGGVLTWLNVKSNIAA